jgi:hypothetical protein
VRDQLHILAALPTGEKLPVANGRWDPEPLGTLCRREKYLVPDRSCSPQIVTILKEVGVNCIMRSFITRTLLQI